VPASANIAVRNKERQRAEQEERVLQVLGNIGGHGNSEREVERAIEVNDMYIESIKAKLKMLD
jgi:hypothetical protein